MKRVWPLIHICSNKTCWYSFHWVGYRESKTVDTCAQITLSIVSLIFVPFTGSIYEYQYYFPVGGKWYWMVAKLLEGGLLSWLKEPFSILSLNQCVCVRVCVCARMPFYRSVYVQMCVSFWRGAERAGACCTSRPCEKKFTWCRQIQPVFSRMERL